VPRACCPTQALSTASTAMDKRAAVFIKSPFDGGVGKILRVIPSKRENAAGGTSDRHALIIRDLVELWRRDSRNAMASTEPTLDGGTTIPRTSRFSPSP
jgi:hypothetical protein